MTKDTEDDGHNDVSSLTPHCYPVHSLIVKPRFSIIGSGTYVLMERLMLTSPMDMLPAT
jgi:hypothetical protein